MKTKIFLLVLCAAAVLTACKGKKTTDTENRKDTQTVADKEATINDLTTNSDSIKIKAVDLQQDISKLPLSELRLLRNWVYAQYGYLFMKADLRGYFSANFKQYDSLMNARWDMEENIYYEASKNKEKAKIPEIVITPEEAAFIKKIDARIAELKKNDYVEKDGYRLANPDNIVNLFQFIGISDEFKQKLATNNMVITPSGNIQLFHIYEENDYRQIPNFITTDLMLQAFHMYFSYTLKLLEQQKFIPIVEKLTYSLYEKSMLQAKSGAGELKEIAAYNATFYAIPYYILTGKKVEVPAEYKKLFDDELRNINKMEDNSSEFLQFEFGFPYSQFKPRGHYTRNEKLSKYFKAMQWLQLAPYCRESEKQLKDAIFVASILNTTKTSDGMSLLQLYQSVFEPIVFLIGEPDNLSVLDIAGYLNKTKIQGVNNSLQAENIAKVNSFLVDLSKTRNRIKPKIELSCPDKINFMPARYLVDNEIIQELVDIEKNAKRAFPKGLDVFAAFGSKTAMDILLNTYKENEQWTDYLPTMKKLQQKFSNYNDWNVSVYNKWIESLLAMQQPDKSYPVFMQLPAWSIKNLNTALASWTDLKHDAILYGEQPMGAECGDGGPPPPITVGYVEPNVKFWSKLSELVVLTQKMLEENNLMTDELKGRTAQMKDYIDFLLTVSNKELKKEKLTESEYNTIEYFGASIEHFTLSVVDPDKSFDEWSQVEGPDKSIAIVADIYTRNIPDCPKNGILHEAVGNANNIFVVVEIEGNLYLTKGATFSYYEFIQPLNNRLTDEEWQEMLEKKKAPSVPVWIEKIMIKDTPKVDERVFYSSGC